MGVEFEEGRSIKATQRPQQVGAVTSYFMKLGLGKTQATVQWVMVLAILIALGLTAYLYLNITKAPPKLTPAQRDEIQLEIMRGR